MVVAHPDIGQCLSFLLFRLALLLVSQPVAMYHLTHTITSAFYMDNIYLKGTFLAGKRNRRKGTFLAGKRNETEGTFLAIRNNTEGTSLAGQRNFQGNSQPLRDCVNSFSPAAPAEAMPKFFLHKLRLLARRKNFRRGFARIRADTRGLRPVPRGSAGRPPKIFFGGLRRTSGERSADTGGLRADTGGSARTPRRTGGRVHSKNVRRQKPL